MKSTLLVLFLVTINLIGHAEPSAPSGLAPENKVEVVDGVAKALDSLSIATVTVNQFYKENYSDIGITLEYAKMAELTGASCTLLTVQAIGELAGKAAVVVRQAYVTKKFGIKDVSAINKEMNDIFANLDYAFKDEGKECLVLAPKLKEIQIQFWSRVVASLSPNQK